MEPREAVQLVDSILAQVSLDRATHAKVIEAVGVLNQVVSILEAQNKEAEKAQIPKIPKTA